MKNFLFGPFKSGISNARACVCVCIYMCILSVCVKIMDFFGGGGYFFLEKSCHFFL